MMMIPACITCQHKEHCSGTIDGEFKCILLVGMADLRSQI
jgi:hypothetical protein